MKKGNAGVVFLVILLFVTVICLCGVLLFYNMDKKEVEQGNNTEVNNETSNNDTTNNSDISNNVNTVVGQTNEDEIVEDEKEDIKINVPSSNIEQKEAKYFDEYLESFKVFPAFYITKNTESFTDEDLYCFVMSYFINKSAKDKSYSIDNTTLKCSYDVTKSEIDQIVSKYFNKSITNYDGFDLSSISTTAPGYGIVKGDAETYKIVWYGGAVLYSRYINPVVTYNGQNVSVKYDNYDMLLEKTKGTVTFKLKYDNANYYIVKIEETLVENTKE